MAKSQTQNGFGIIGVVVVGLVVVVIAATGFVVFRHNNKTSVEASTTPKTSESTTESDNTSTRPAQTAQQYFTIKEWGVQAAYSGSLTLGYSLSSDSTSITVSSAQLTKLSGDCTGRGGGIKRWAATDKVSVYPDDSAPTAESVFSKADPSTYAHIGNYYYTFLHDQAACGDPSITASMQSQTNDTVKALVPKLQATGS